ncbi:MAG: helix-turn-helix domain-containing protein [Rhabdochlamydiaceae bacterium]|jgi:cytoskeletal protein RodZ
MTEELKRLGEMLKMKRAEKNLSLKEVENATSIRQNHLESIEEGTINDHLAAVYALGFMKQYATFLGLEVDKLMKENPGAFQNTVTKQEFSYGIGTLEKRGSQSGGVKWFPNILWAGLSAVVLIAAWYLAKALGVL